MAEPATTTSVTGQTPETKKRRKPQGPRQARPMFAIVTYSDENGNDVVLNKANLQIKLERDAAKLLDLVTGAGVGPAAVVRVEMPAPTPRAGAQAAAS